jgi:hypothetical protein
MRNAKHARIAFNCHRDGTSHPHLLRLDHYWDFLAEFVHKFGTGAKDPVLSVKVAFQYKTTNTIHPTANPAEFPAFTSGSFSSPPPAVLDDMTLLQRTEGYRLAHCIFEEVPAWSFNVVTALGCYLFQSGAQKAARLWNKDEILNIWLASETNEPHWLSFGVTRCLTETGAPHVFGGWREKSGHGEAVEWLEEESL